MIVLTGDTTMLYCPKCRRTYEEGTQRFCDNDGGRLLPAPTVHKPDSPPTGVFTNLLGKVPQTDAENKINPAPRFIPLNKTEESGKKLTSFPSAGRIFQSEQFLKPKPTVLPEIKQPDFDLEPLEKAEDDEFLLELDAPTAKPEVPMVKTEPEKPAVKIEIETPKPLPRIVKQSEIPSGTALVGDRRTNPAGRPALSWENTDALLGQTVKGRYQVTAELAGDDDESLIYLAEDKIINGRKVVVRVFMHDRSADDSFEEKIFAEERVSLSHLNHPNIAAFFDSGELPEGREFIVTEFIEGKSLAEMLHGGVQFNSLRTARIIRQTSYALSEAHQNGILHRNLKPENILMTVSEAGIEQVKLMNFGVSHGEITDENLVYKAPEELESGISTFASDIYALAVIAFQMLIGRVPYEAAEEKDLLKMQKQGWAVSPPNLRTDIQPLTDKILEKALAFKPSERYPKARDFGDAFFNALTTVAPWTKEDEAAKKREEVKAEAVKAEEIKVEEEKVAEQKVFVTVPAIKQPETVEDAPIAADIHITPREEFVEDAAETDEIKAIEDLPWEKRSPELPKTGSALSGWLVILGVIVLLLAFWGISRLFLNRSNQNDVNQSQANINENTPVLPPEQTPVNSLNSGEPDIAPEPRVVKQPENTVRFQNSRDKLQGDLAKNFLGFDIFYPESWTKAETPTNFLDIKKSAPNSKVPVEQMIITRYPSTGTMTFDRPNFPKLVEKSNQDLKKFFGDSYKVLSNNETKIQDGRWKAFEVRFQGQSQNEKGDRVTIWGRRLWIPIQRAGMPNGFVITMLATSLSDDVKSVEDVGVKGELAGVLETFEPEQF